MRVGINRRAIGWVAASVLAAGAAPAMAQGAALQWHCWVDGGERLRCVLDGAQADGFAHEGTMLQVVPDALAMPSQPALSSLPLSSPLSSRSSSPSSPVSSSLPSSTAGAATAARKLPPIVAQLRDQPHALAGQVIAIPLYSVTDDWPRVTQLARAVLCTSDRPCAIRLSTSLNDALGKGLDTDRLFVGPDLGWIGPTSMR